MKVTEWGPSPAGGSNGSSYTRDWNQRHILAQSMMLMRNHLTLAWCNGGFPGPLGRSGHFLKCPRSFSFPARPLHSAKEGWFLREMKNEGWLIGVRLNRLEWQAGSGKGDVVPLILEATLGPLLWVDCGRPGGSCCNLERYWDVVSAGLEAWGRIWSALIWFPAFAARGCECLLNQWPSPGFLQTSGITFRVFMGHTVCPKGVNLCASRGFCWTSRTVSMTFYVPFLHLVPSFPKLPSASITFPHTATQNTPPPHPSLIQWMLLSVQIRAPAGENGNIFSPGKHDHKFSLLILQQLH